MSVFDLSKYLLLEILGEWLDIQELISLDSAVCNASTRNTFLTLMKSITISTDICERFTDIKFDRYKWLRKRNVSVELLSLTKSKRILELTGTYNADFLGRVKDLKLNNLDLVTEYFLLQTMRFAEKLHTLDVYRAMKISMVTCKVVPEFSSNLLNIYFCKCTVLSMDTFMKILTKCPKLTKLHVDSCGFSHAFRKLPFLSLTDLENINFTNNKRLPTSCISHIIAHTTVLSCITLMFGIKQVSLSENNVVTISDKVDDLDVDFYSDSDEESDDEKPRNLCESLGIYSEEELDFQRYVQKNFPDKYTANKYHNPNLHDSNISDLNFDKTTPRTDYYEAQCAIYEIIATHCAESLVQLQLDFACPFTMPILLQKCKNLKFLDLHQHKDAKLFISDILMQAIGAYCSELTWLNLNNCVVSLEHGFESIAKNCRKLEFLNISPSRAVEMEIRSGFYFPGSAIGANMTTLTRLDLFGIDQFSDLDRDLVSVFIRCKLLSFVNVGCTNVGDVSILAIIEHCQNIRSLGLRRLGAMSTATLFLVVTKCVNLTCLDISHNTTVDQVCVSLIGFHLHNLHLIKMQGCPNLQTDSDDPVCAIALRCCTHLSRAVLSYKLDKTIEKHHPALYHKVEFALFESDVFDHLEEW